MRSWRGALLKHRENITFFTFYPHIYHDSSSNSCIGISSIGTPQIWFF